VIAIAVQIADHFDRIQPAVERASYQNLAHAAASIRKDAIASIEEKEGPSLPGTPPHTHTAKTTRTGKRRLGHLPRAIVFHNDRQAKSAVVGPRQSVVGTAGQAHEFGGEYKEETFPERPFMNPAMTRNIDRFAADWQGSIGE
jgi:hypothetical protein